RQPLQFASAVALVIEDVRPAPESAEAPSLPVVQTLRPRLPRVAVEVWNGFANRRIAFLGVLRERIACERHLWRKRHEGKECSGRRDLRHRNPPRPSPLFASTSSRRNLLKTGNHTLPLGPHYQ